MIRLLLETVLPRAGVPGGQRAFVAILLLVVLGRFHLSGSAAAADAAESAAFRPAVADARAAMAQRDLVAAQKHLAKAAETAQTPEQQQEVTRLETLLDYQKQFWELLRQGVAKLESGEELVVKTTRVAVVEASRDELLIKAAGRMLRYRVEDMPVSLVLVMAERSLAKDAVSKMAVGTFLLFDEKGDRQVAARLWREAAAAGIDMEDLLPELQAAPGAGGGQTAVPSDQVKLRQAELAVRETFRLQYAQATAPPGQEELARKLLAAAPAGDSPESRYVMFRQARDLAVAASNPALACEAMDQMGKVFPIDVLAMQVEALEEIGKAARRLSGQKQIVEAALKLIQKAAEAGRLDEASRLVDVGLAAAQKSQNRMLLEQVSTAAQQIEARRKQHGQGK